MINNRFDLHVHSHYSYDCKSDPKDILKIAKKKQLSGIAITDHNVIKFHQNKHTSKGLLVIPGIEVSTNKGHVIGLGIKNTVEKRLSVKETIEKIIDLGGYPVIPHPFDFTRKGIGKELHELKGIGIETINGSCPLGWFNEKAKKWAVKSSLPETGGSDSHRLKDIGLAYTVFENEIESVEELIEEIRKGKSESQGSHLSIAAKIVRAFQIHF